MRKLTTFLLLLAMLIPTAGAQSTDIFKKKKKKNSKTEAVDKAKADSIAKAKKSPFQPYASVITGKAKTMNGFFKVHCIEGKYFFEIPDSLFGRDILIVNRIVKAPVDKQKRKAGYPGDHISDEVIRFELGRDNKLFIRQISYLEHSTDTLGMYQAVLNSNVQPIVATFPLKTMRKDSLTKNYVIEMTDFIHDGEAVNRPNNAMEIYMRELGSESPLLVKLIMKSIYKNDDREIKHIGSKRFGIQYTLKGIYTHNGLLYFHMQLKNSSNVPFDVDFITFKIVDKKLAKRTAIQEQVIVPLRAHNNLTLIGGKRTERVIFTLPKFTIPDDKHLIIELNEKEGGRHQSFVVENADLIRAKVINELKVK